MISHLVHASSLALLIAGCANDPASPADGGTDPLPRTTGTFVSSYRVPTVSADLEPAATFRNEHADWTVTGDTVTLHYELPIGLVGGEVEVTLTGTLGPGATSVDISGPVGTGVCTRSANIVTCLEDFDNLGTLPISSAEIARVAGTDYAGPAQHRIDVANVFGSDPIGVLYLDLDRPYVEIEDEDD